MTAKPRDLNNDRKPGAQIMTTTHDLNMTATPGPENDRKPVT